MKAPAGAFVPMRRRGDGSGALAGAGSEVETRGRTPRVAFVAASLDLLGGQGIQANVLSRRLNEEGYRVALIPVNPRLPRGLGWLQHWRYLRTLANEVAYLVSLAGLARCEAVQVFSASYFSFLLGPAPALLAARLMGKRTILNYHSGEADDHLARWGVLVHPWLRLADEIVVPSEYLRDVFSRHGYRTTVIENFVETGHFIFRERPVLRPRLLSVRNLEPHYRVDLVIRAFALVKRRYPGATLVVAGYGSEERRLRRLAASLHADGISFRGRYDPSAAPALYDGADIFVNASEVDNQPVSVLEAFASGLPVVSTPTGDIASMLAGGEAGEIVPPGDPEALATAVCRLVESPGLGLEFTRRARIELERFGWSRVREKWRSLYAVTAP